MPMKTSLLHPALVWIALSGLLAAAPTEWKAAAAKTVITPTEPMYLAGAAARAMNSLAKAMVLPALSSQHMVDG